MSALDDAVSVTENMQVNMGASVPMEAREELELLREAAFENTRLDIEMLQCAHIMKHGHQGDVANERHRRILRTDPERAKKMGLGWAL